jgi:hypothetical protein
MATFPSSKIGDRPYKGVDINQTAEGKAYFAAITDLLQMPLPLAEGKRNELKPREIHLSAEAKHEWIKYHNYIEELMQEGRELSAIRGFAAKSAEHAARLAGILALVENPATTTILHHTMLAGIELSQFYVGESLRLFYSTNDDKGLILAEECLQWAIEYGGQFSLPCLYQKGPNKVRSKETAKQVVRTLTQHDRVLPVKGGAVIDGTKRRDVWKVIA